MKNYNLFLIFFLIIFNSCNSLEKKNQSSDQYKNIPDSIFDFYGITNRDSLSAASKRALNWPKLSNDWFVEFEVYDLKGDFAYEEGVVRRDPSSIIKYDGKYFCWYTRSTGKVDGFAGDIENDKVFPWDRADIWFATSEDGITWKEEGPAIERGPKGAYDDRSVFTSEIMTWDGKYYLCYQTVKSPYTVRVKEHVALAWADSPMGLGPNLTLQL